MNETLDPTQEARIAEYLVGATVCPAGVDQLNATTKALYDYTEHRGAVRPAPLYNNPPTSRTAPDTKEWTDTYTEIKAGVGS